MLPSTSYVASLASASHARTLAKRAAAPAPVSLVSACKCQQTRYFWRSRADLPSLEPEAERFRHCHRAGVRVSRILFKNHAIWQKRSNVSTWEDPLHAIKRSWFPKFLDSLEPESGAKSEPGSSDYVIDPITNRKVLKNSSNVNSSNGFRCHQLRRTPYLATEAMKMFDRQRELLAQRLARDPRMVHPDGTPPADELDKYRKVDIGIPSYNEELIHRVNDLPERQPQGVPPDPPQPASQAPEPPVEYTDLDKYKKVDINYPPSMNEELIHRVGDLPEKPSVDDVPAQKPKKAKESDQPYEDLDMYKPYMNAEEAVDLESDGVMSRSWPSRVRHLEQNIGAAPPNKAVENRAERSASPNGRGFSAQVNAPTRRQRSFKAQPFGTKPEPESEPTILHSDPYSKEPTGLELSWAKECVEDPKANKLYIRHYSPDGTASEPVVLSPSGEEKAAGSIVAESVGAEDASPSTRQQAGGEATLYKILAYDPTMQTISTAETKSAVSDSATPLSPAEVMVRLSNPAKFFPHFKPLQEEGFEIVSGSGDVLVFRKVRKVAEAVAPKDVNPIDMMGRRVVPEVGNFANPTGYVSPYDYTVVDEEDILRRPEHTNGQTETDRYTGENTQPKGRGVLRRTATGVAWLAGTAYGVGVISEVFSKEASGSKSTKHDS